jgi:hypothetical protein
MTTENPNPTDPAAEPAAQTTEPTILEGAVTNAVDEKSTGEGEADTGDKTGDDADKGEEAKADGPPEAYDLAMPEGFALDADMLAKADPILREVGLTNEAANKLVPLVADVVSNAMKAAEERGSQEIAAVRKGWADAALQDAEIGGSPDKLAATKESSAKFMDRFAPETFDPVTGALTPADKGGVTLRQWLGENGLGNHPVVIRTFARAGQAIAEDGFIRSDGSAPGEKSTSELFYGNDYQRKDPT